MDFCLLEVVLVVAAVEESAVDFRVKGFHATIEEFGRAGEF